MVDDVEQTLASLVHRAKQFKASDGELIQAYILVFIQSAQRCDVL